MKSRMCVHNSEQLLLFGFFPFPSVNESMMYMKYGLSCGIYPKPY